MRPLKAEGFFYHGSPTPSCSPSLPDRKAGVLDPGGGGGGGGGHELFGLGTEVIEPPSI